MVRLHLRLEHGPGCPWCSSSRELTASGPILCHPLLQWHPEAVGKPVAWPTYELLGLIGLLERF
jgi:hypothetical protein